MHDPLHPPTSADARSTLVAIGMLSEKQNKSCFHTLCPVIRKVLCNQRPSSARRALQGLHHI
eukprot:6179885-Pleurochrysis_carterae.AAC.2